MVKTIEEVARKSRVPLVRRYEAMRFMAERANSHTIEIDASTLRPMLALPGKSDRGQYTPLQPKRQRARHAGELGGLPHRLPRLLCQAPALHGPADVRPCRRCGELPEVPALELRRPHPVAHPHRAKGAHVARDRRGQDLPPDHLPLGRTEGEARTILRDAGFEVSVEYDDSTPSQKGIVLRQDPSGSSSAPEGSTSRSPNGLGVVEYASSSSPSRSARAASSASAHRRTT